LALEKEAYPALDELATRVSTRNLEHVRQIKSRLVELLARVQKVVYIIGIWESCALDTSSSFSEAVIGQLTASIWYLRVSQFVFGLWWSAVRIAGEG
jgi:hypothetical protein